jgi:hypothetical protein
MTRGFVLRSSMEQTHIPAVGTRQSIGPQHRHAAATISRTHPS